MEAFETYQNWKNYVMENMANSTFEKRDEVRFVSTGTKLDCPSIHSSHVDLVSSLPVKKRQDLTNSNKNFGLKEVYMHINYV